MKLPDINKSDIGILGMGYVGLPLAIEFAKYEQINNSGSTKRRIIGFDIDISRINQLKNSFDKTGEITKDEFYYAKFLEFESDINILSEVDIFIVTVPTPIDSSKKPDFSPLESACAMIGKSLLKRHSKCHKKEISPIIIFESTVFPGATEEICVPIIENNSNLKFNSEFFVGYSPERINPGNSVYKLTNIVKVTSGSTLDVAKKVDSLYKLIIKAGTHLAPSIKVAEAAKVIENTQRDLNIALMNELAIIFKKIGIDTRDVLKAASTKWNFLNFKPGLVGGHCIGVDPYYLTHKSRELGYYPQVVLAGRKINDSMAEWISKEIISELGKRNLNPHNKNLLILGVTFKANCPDVRNTKVVDLICELNKYNFKITIIDPLADKDEVYSTYKINIENKISFNKKYDVVVSAVAHDEFTKKDINFWENLIKKDLGIYFDLNDLIPRDLNPIRL